MVALPLIAEQYPLVLPILNIRELTALHYVSSNGPVRGDATSMETHGFTETTLVILSMMQPHLMDMDSVGWFTLTDAGIAAVANNPLPEPPLAVVRKEKPTRGNGGYFWGAMNARSITPFGYEDMHLRSTWGDWSF